MKNLARRKPFDSPYFWKDIAGSYSFTSNLVFMKQNIEILSCRCYFGTLFLDWKSTVPCQFLVKITWNITFLKLLSLFHLFQKQKYLKNLARNKLFDSPYLWIDIVGSCNFTPNLKFIKWNWDNGSCITFFGPFFRNWKITAPCLSLMKSIGFHHLLYSYLFQSEEYLKSFPRRKFFDLPDIKK